MRYLTLFYHFWQYIRFTATFSCSIMIECTLKIQVDPWTLFMKNLELCHFSLAGQSCQLHRLSCGVAATCDSLWTCSKFGNQSLVAATGSFVWTSSCGNLARFYHFATLEEMKSLFWFTVAECLYTQSLVTYPPATHASCSCEWALRYTGIIIIIITW